MGRQTDDHQQLKRIENHEKYYLVGGDLYLLIGITMFKVHSYFFNRESKRFFNKEKDPASPGHTPQGKSENTAIVIEDVTVEEFEHFLWVFYNPKYNLYDTTPQVWITILKLAHGWGFGEVKNFALRELKKQEDQLPLVDRIVFYQKYNAPPEYLVPLFAKLCARPFSPTDEESHLLGLEQAFKVMRARELIRAQSVSGGQSPLPQGVDEGDIYPTISSVLNLPDFVPEPSSDPSASGSAPRMGNPKKNSTGRTSGRTV